MRYTGKLHVSLDRTRANAFNRTKDTDTNSGTCYTDGKNAGFGCGVFVEGDDCEMTGDQMAA